MDARARTGFFGWLRAVLGNGHYWLYLLHSIVIDFPLKTISFTVIVTWVATGLGGITYWFWGLFLPNGSRDFSVVGVGVGAHRPADLRERVRR